MGAMWRRHWPLFLFGLGLLGLATTVAAIKINQSRTELAKIAGPISLIDTYGTRVTDADLRGKPTVLFFGFTTCPDFCPITLNALARSMVALGPSADQINFMFITVDPERDTPEALASYLSNFEGRIRGLTGTLAAITDVARSYGINYQKVPIPDGGYVMDHPSSLFLYDANGKLVDVIGFGTEDGERIQRLQKLIYSLKPTYRYQD